MNVCDRRCFDGYGPFSLLDYVCFQLLHLAWDRSKNRHFRRVWTSENIDLYLEAVTKQDAFLSEGDDRDLAKICTNSKQISNFCWILGYKNLKKRFFVMTLSSV